MFPVVIPDNMKSIVIMAENTAPRINDTFMEYAQSRGFVIDAARVATPTDKPRGRTRRALRAAQLLRRRVLRRPGRLPSAGRDLVLDHRRDAHSRHHPVPTHRGLPAEELPLLLPRPGAPFDTPKWSDPKVHRDFHVEVDKAIYSVPHHLVGRTLRARLTRPQSSCT